MYLSVESIANLEGRKVPNKGGFVFKFLNRKECSADLRALLYPENSDQQYITPFLAFLKVFLDSFLVSNFYSILEAKKKNSFL